LPSSATKPVSRGGDGRNAAVFQTIKNSRLCQQRLGGGNVADQLAMRECISNEVARGGFPQQR
jgi:hypothetical protein